MAGGSVGSILGFLLAGPGDLAGLLATVGMIGGAVLFDRAWRRGDLENESRRLEEAVARLPTRPGEPSLAGGDRDAPGEPPTSE